MSDPAEDALRHEVARTCNAYLTARERLHAYERRQIDTLKREAKADPATLERVREEVNALMLRPSVHDREKSSVGVAMAIAKEANMPSAKTLQNVYLPAIREDCPHAVQVGREWMWFKDARTLASRDTGSGTLKG